MSDSTVYLEAGLTDCGVIGKHSKSLERAFAVAPATSKEFNVIGLPLIPIACWRMDDARFDFNSAFVRPTSRKEFDLLRELVQSHPGSPLSIFGHTDPTGDDAYNKQLSGRRAKAIYATLIRNTAFWEELYAIDGWGLKQVQTILQALKDENAQPFYNGDLDGYDGPQTQQALRSFQKETGLSASGKNDSATRSKLFLMYMDFLCTAAGSKDTLKLTKEDFLGRGSDKGGKGDYQGCGEFNPVLVFSKEESERFKKPEMKSRRDLENLPNRRVTIFLFQKGRQILTAKWPCPRWNEGVADCKKQLFPNADSRRNPQEVRRNHEASQGTPQDTFGCRFYDGFAQGSPCEGTTKLVAFKLRLCNHEKDPIRRAPFRIIQGRTSTPGETDPDDACLLVIARDTPEMLRIEWTTPDRKDDPDYPFSLEMYVAPGPGEDGVFQRLHNVGYSRELTLQDKSRAFQADLGHTQTGRLTEEETRMLFEWHDGGEKPFSQTEKITGS
jgi:OmpA family/Putative peptidoglycan binding domain